MKAPGALLPPRTPPQLPRILGKSDEPGLGIWGQKEPVAPAARRGLPVGHESLQQGGVLTAGQRRLARRGKRLQRGGWIARVPPPQLNGETASY